MHSFTISIVLNLTVVFAAIIGMIRFKYILNDFYPFLIIIWLGLMNELLSLVIVFNIRTNAVNSNVFVLLEYLLILVQFYKWNNSNRSKYYWIAGIGVSVWITDNLVINNLNDNNSLFRVFYSLVIVFFSINQVNKLIIYEKGNLLKNATFLVCITFLFYYSCKAFVEAFNAFHLGLSYIFLWNLWIILYFVNVIANLMYAIAILCIPTKREFILPLTGVAVFLALLAFFIITIIRYQRKKVAFHLEKIKEEFYYLDQERERIAIDLHDDLGASLSAIKLRLQCMENLDEKNAPIIENSEKLIDQAMKRLRQISFNMMPAVLQRSGLDEALKELIDLMTYPAGIAVNYRFDAGLLDKARSLHIYRICQEILNNIVKHAKATSVYFAMIREKNTIELNIKDNGVGFNKDTVMTGQAGAGLRNITARTDLLKAKLYLTTARGKGVDYLIQIPV